MNSFKSVNDKFHSLLTTIITKTERKVEKIIDFNLEITIRMKFDNSLKFIEVSQFREGFTKQLRINLIAK